MFAILVIFLGFVSTMVGLTTIGFDKDTGLPSLIVGIILIVSGVLQDKKNWKDK